jgi:hypothetical protein
MFRRRSGISEQHPRHRAVLDGVSVRRRFTASSFPVLGLCATSRRLGRVTILPQLKVDRLCSVVDGTADFDPKRTSPSNPHRKKRAQRLLNDIEGSASAVSPPQHACGSKQILEALRSASPRRLKGSQPVQLDAKKRRGELGLRLSSLNAGREVQIPYSSKEAATNHGRLRVGQAFYG